MLSEGNAAMIYAVLGVLIVGIWILILVMKGVHKD